MYTINIRGKQNPKDTKMVKLEIIFFKTGYARVPKVINITGLLKDWDNSSEVDAFLSTLLFFIISSFVLIII